jgi:hypothetical protein
MKDWRAEVLPADAFRVSTEVQMHEIYAAFIEVAGQLYRQTGQMRYAEESFAVAEDGRTASLRMLWATSDLPKQLPQEYWLTVSELQKAQAARLREGPEDGAVRRLRVKLAEMEAAAGLELPAALVDNDPAAGGCCKSPVSRSDQTGCFWGFTRASRDRGSGWSRGRSRVSGLPPEDDLKNDIGDFVQALRKSSPETRVLDSIYISNCSGRLPQRAEHADMDYRCRRPSVRVRRLCSGEPRLARHLALCIERHAIRIVPGVSALLRPPPADLNEMFVGVGDPIYNRADPRLTRVKRTAASSTVEASGVDSAPGIMELPRLFGSAREVDSCAKIWQSEGAQWMVLKGPAANKRELAQALRSGPSVVHVAAHMLFPPQEADRGMVALSLRSGSPVELLSDTETAGAGKLGLVVLNGCGSASPVLPGAGTGMSGPGWRPGPRRHLDALAHIRSGTGRGFPVALSPLFPPPRRWPGVVWSVVAKGAVGGTACRRRPGGSCPLGVLFLRGNELSGFRVTDSRGEMSQEPEVDWRNVVNLIQRGDPAGEEALYKNLLRGARRFLQRHLGRMWTIGCTTSS